MDAGAAAWDLSTILPLRPASKWGRRRQAKKRRSNLRCYHHSGMKAENIGRVLGIGLRVAGRMAGQKLAGGAQAAGAQTAGGAQAGQNIQTGQVGRAGRAGRAGQAAASGRAAKQADVRAKGQAAGRTAKGVARGVGGFLRPFRRVGGILWLEVTGAFFLLFAVAAALPLWRHRPSNFYGSYDKNFLAAAGIMVVFFYLGVSSFWRARRR